MKPIANLSNRNILATIKVITPSMMLATKMATIPSTQTTAMATAAIKGSIRLNSPATMDCLLLNGCLLSYAIYRWLSIIFLLGIANYPRPR